MIHSAYTFNKDPNAPEACNSVSFDGKTWVPARGMQMRSLKQKLKEVWLVWTGQADVLVWPGQERP